MTHSILNSQSFAVWPVGAVPLWKAVHSPALVAEVTFRDSYESPTKVQKILISLIFFIELLYLCR